MDLMFFGKILLIMAVFTLFTTTPVFAQETAGANSVRIAQLEIKPDQLSAFLAAVKEEMREALLSEPGVIALYAVADKNDETRLTFFEIYVDDEAYQIHRQTPHFKKYYETTKDMISSRVLIEAVPIEMRDKHNTIK